MFKKMSALTSTQLIALRDAYLAAETKILLRQSYSMGEKQLTMADLSDIQAERKRLDNQIKASLQTGPSTNKVTFTRP